MLVRLDTSAATTVRQWLFDGSVRVGQSMRPGPIFLEELPRAGRDAVWRGPIKTYGNWQVALALKRRPLSFCAQPRNAFADTDDALCLHLRSRNLLDLSGGARSIVDKNALTQSQIDDVLLARDLFRDHGGRERRQGEASDQRKKSDARGHCDHQTGPLHLFCIFRPLGPTLICRPSGSFLV